MFYDGANRVLRQFNRTVQWSGSAAHWPPANEPVCGYQGQNAACRQISKYYCLKKNMSQWRNDWKFGLTRQCGARSAINHLRNDRDGFCSFRQHECGSPGCQCQLVGWWLGCMFDSSGTSSAHRQDIRKLVAIEGSWFDVALSDVRQAAFSLQFHTEESVVQTSHVHLLKSKSKSFSSCFWTFSMPNLTGCVNVWMSVILWSTTATNWFTNSMHPYWFLWDFEHLRDQHGVQIVVYSANPRFKGKVQFFSSRNHCGCVLPLINAPKYFCSKGNSPNYFFIETYPCFGWPFGAKCNTTVYAP